LETFHDLGDREEFKLIAVAGRSAARIFRGIGPPPCYALRGFISRRLEVRRSLGSTLAPYGFGEAEDGILLGCADGHPFLDENSSSSSPGTIAARL
jgi:hypothetical protein